MSKNPESVNTVITEIDWPDFLASSPAGMARSGIKNMFDAANSREAKLAVPDVRLYCKECNGTMRFKGRTQQGREITVSVGKENWCFLFYRCRNCDKTNKYYALLVSSPSKYGSGSAMKVGEFPIFGERTPPRLFRMLSERDRSLFLRGRRSENEGLGIGASAYYRRIVENQKDHLFDEIIKVAKRLDENEIASDLEAEKKNYQFTKSIDAIKLAIPDKLMIRGENPLILLHNALSKDIHTRSDEECLKDAHHIREILVELARRITDALQERRGLDEAVKALKKVQ